MNEITFTPHHDPVGAFSFSHEEAFNGIAKIHITENFDELRDLFRYYGLASWIAGREKYNTYDEFIEDRVEGSITHETLHYLVLITEGEQANRGLDHIDCTPEGYRTLR